jgi:hypothetical protein
MKFLSMASVTRSHNVTLYFISRASFTPSFKHLSTIWPGSLVGAIRGLPRIGEDNDLASIAGVITGTGVGVFSIIMCKTSKGIFYNQLSFIPAFS